MPSERQRWINAPDLAAVNIRMPRHIETFDKSDRYAALTQNTTATIALTYPLTLLQCDTTAGAVVITLPSAASVPGYRVDALKTAGANALTVSGTSVTASKAFISTGALWRAL